VHHHAATFSCPPDPLDLPIPSLIAVSGPDARIL